jgi:hypothetical protein
VAFYTLEDSQRRVGRIRAIADDLPVKAGADLSQGARLGVPKHDDILRVEGDDKINVVALKCHQPFRAVDIRGQWNLPRASGDQPLRASVLAYAKR